MKAHLCVALAAGLGGPGCVEPADAPALTGVELLVSSDPTLGIDRLTLSGAVDGELAFPATTLPDPPRRLDPAREDVVVLVDEIHGGRALELTIDARADGLLATRVRLQIELITGDVVPVTVGLGAQCGEYECWCGEQVCRCEDHGRTSCPMGD